MHFWPHVGKAKMRLEGLSYFSNLKTYLDIPNTFWLHQHWVKNTYLKICSHFNQQTFIWITLYYWNVCSFYHTPYFSQWRPHSWYGRKNSWCLKRYYGWTSSQIELRIVQWNDGEHHETHNGNKSWCSQPFSSSFFFSLKKIFLVDTFDRKKTVTLVIYDGLMFSWCSILERLTRLHINN